jgi:hypothetical protein
MWESVLAGKFISICAGAAAIFPDRRRPHRSKQSGISPALRLAVLCARSSCLEAPSEWHRASSAAQP